MLALCVLVPERARGADGGAASVVDLVRRADLIWRGKTSAAVISMQIKTRSFEREYKIVVWDDARAGGEDRTLIKILGPASFRGSGTLKIGNQLKIFDPATNHVTVVGHSMLGDSWMGSHFSNDDLVKETRLDRDYDVRELGSKTETTALGAGSIVHELELRPRPTAPVAWGRIVFRIAEHGADLIPLDTAYFRKPADRQPERRMVFEKVRSLGGRTVPAQATVTVADKPGEHTRILYDDLRFDVDIPAAKFTEQALRK